jgi:hypothetical protein
VYDDLNLNNRLVLEKFNLKKKNKPLKCHTPVSNIRQCSINGWKNFSFLNSSRANEITVTYKPDTDLYFFN